MIKEINLSTEFFNTQTVAMKINEVIRFINAKDDRIEELLGEVDACRAVIAEIEAGKKNNAENEHALKGE